MAGKLPHPDETYSREDIVHMFGLFSKSISNTDETTCHFCLNDISQSSVPSLNTECCNQTAHCKCFETWIHSSFIRTRNVQSSCAYCHSNYNDEKCFLYLKKVEQNEEYLESTCCKTKLHANCITKLHQFYDTKEIKPYLECGHIGCNCLWVDI